MLSFIRGLMGICLAAVAGVASGLTPEQIFVRVAPSIVVVKSFGPDSKPISLGSGVSLGDSQIITNCHVVASGSKFLVSQADHNFNATVEVADIERDLCLLRAPGFQGPAANMGSANAVKPGAKVFAIGAPQGLELSISEGLASAVRPIEGGVLIQTSAAISRGSSGGGLFDSEGRLIGITTFTLVEAQNVNFALPIEWVAEIRTRTLEVLSASVGGLNARDLQDDVPKFEDPASRAWVSAVSSALVEKFPNLDASHAFSELVIYESLRAGLDVSVVLGVIDNVSSFRKYYVARSGATGLMQVMPAWKGRIGRPDHNLFQERVNLRYGCTILRYYLDKYKGNLRRALNAYQNQAKGRPEAFDIDSSTFTRAVMLSVGKWPVYKLSKPPQGS